MSWCRNQDVVSQMWGNITFSLENSNGQKWIWHTGKCLVFWVLLLLLLSFQVHCPMGCSVHEVDVRRVHLSLTKLMLQFKTLTAPLLERCSQPTLQLKEVNVIFLPLHFVMEKETWCVLSQQFLIWPPYGQSKHTHGAKWKRGRGSDHALLWVTP